MKMKKMLAALLAVCMLLTMLPLAAFAASNVTVLNIQYDGEDFVIYDENGDIIPCDDSEGDWSIWDNENWYFSAATLALIDGTFKVTTDTLLELL